MKLPKLNYPPDKNSFNLEITQHIWNHLHMKDLMCNNCGIRPKQSNGKYNGRKIFKKTCARCTKYPNLKDKAAQKHCSICHKEYHFSQLDVDHIRSAKRDDNYDNLQVICSNCHRLKTYMNKESGPQGNK